MEVAEKIASELVLSPKLGETLRKWRNIFKLTQKELAAKLNISTTVISDYENGRRRSLNTKTLRKITYALVSLGYAKGRLNAREPKDVFLLKDFMFPVKAKRFIDSINGKLIAGKNYVNRYLHGYTILNSLKAILKLQASDYTKVYGYSSERALIFTHVKYGRSPMVAIRAHPLKPGMVIYQNPKRVDKLAIELGNLERIPLVITKLDLKSLTRRLERLGMEKCLE
jgi:putative transcriptional regulator